MTEQVIVYQGTVTKVDSVGPWTLFHTRQNQKPVAFKDYKGNLPRPRMEISVEVNPGNRWDFGIHHTLSMSLPPKPYWPPPAESEQFYRTLYKPIHDWLQHKELVSADDVHDEIMSIIPGRDPRVIGWVFGWASKKKLIKTVSRIKSVRGHHREIPTWTRGAKYE